MRVLKVWTSLLLILSLSIFASPFAHISTIPGLSIPSALAATGPVYQVSLDANSLSQTDLTVSTNASQSKSFRVGAVINSSATSPLTGVYGWQFEITYNSTAFIPEGDPNPFGGYPDGATSTAFFGSQTTKGSVNWAGQINVGQAFGGAVILPVDATYDKIRVFFTELNPNPAVSISAKTILANVNFELLSRPSTPQSFNVTRVKFVDITAESIPGLISGPPVVETVMNSSPVASFIYSPAINTSPTAFNFNATSSYDPDGTIRDPTGYFWDFGDGARDLGVSGRTVTHDFGVTRGFKVSLRVQDSLGATGSARDELGLVIQNNQPSHTQHDVGGDLPPIASFVFFHGFNAPDIRFDASNSTDPDGNIVSYQWSFGDGSFSIPLASPFTDHIYQQVGNYSVTLTVLDNSNQTGNATHIVVVSQTDGDEPPIAAFTYTPSSPIAGQPVYFNGTSSTDPDGTIRDWYWIFGDQTHSYGNGSQASHTYSAPGNYAVELTVVDSSGLAGATSAIISVGGNQTDQPPVALFSFSSGNVTTAQVVDFYGGASYDPDGFIQTWSWSFGDGFTSFSVSTSHHYNRPGTYTVVMIVTDNAGVSATTSAVVLVRADVPPIASFTFTPSSPKVGQFVFFDGSASFDPDGFIQTWLWSFGDGSSATNFGPQTNHFFDAPGNYTVTLTVFDDGGESATASMTVPVHPRPQHDVAIISVNAYPQKVVSSQTVGVQVVLTNNGSSNETVSVTAYYSGNVIGTETGISLPANCSFCNGNVYINIAWDTTGVRAGNYTISATVFLPTDQNPSDNGMTDGQVQVLPTPVLTISPTNGSPGTTVTLHGTNFPEIPPYYRQRIGVVEVTFDDQLMGFTNSYNGNFNFTFSIPLSQAGPHLIKALDEITGAHAATDFQVLATLTQGNLAVTVQVGTIYFPSDTVLVYSQVTLNGQPTTQLSLQFRLFLPNGSAIALAAQSIGPGLYKATFPVPKSGSLGTYLVVGTAHMNAALDASSSVSFEVKQSWLNSNAPKITAGLAGVALVGFAVVAWRRGYFRRKPGETVPF